MAAAGEDAAGAERERKEVADLEFVATLADDPMNMVLLAGVVPRVVQLLRSNVGNPKVSARSSSVWSAAGCVCSVTCWSPRSPAWDRYLCVWRHVRVCVCVCVYVCMCMCVSLRG